MSMRPLRRIVTLALLLGVPLVGGLAAWALASPAHRPSARAPRASHARSARVARPSRAPRGVPAAPPVRERRSRRHHGPAVVPPRSWQGRWAAPVQAIAAAPTDLLPPVLALGPADRLALGSGTTSEDDPASAHAAISQASGGAFATATSLTGIQQTLAAGFDGTRLGLLVGASPSNQACCSTASVLLGSDGSFSGEQIAVGLQGPTTGALARSGSGFLAAVDNQSGITVARVDAAGGAVRTAQLIGTDPTPPVMALSPVAGGGAVIAWTAPSVAAQTVTGTSTTPGTTPTSAPAAGYDQPQNRLIDFAVAGPRGLPGPVRLALTLPVGHEVDALALAPHGRGATLAWTETWFAGGTFRSQVLWADLRQGAVPHVLSDPAQDAVGVSLAGVDGRQVLTWQSCTIAGGACHVAAALRPHGVGWTPVRDLGAVDPTQFPVAAMSPLGQSLVGWITHGVVEARPAAPGAVDFLAAHRVSRPSPARAGAGAPAVAPGGAAALALVFGTGSGRDGDAEAAWVQGTVDQQLLSARFTP